MRSIQAILLVLILTASLVCGGVPNQDYVKGAVFFKTYTQLNTILTSTGSPAIDNFISSIEADRLERTFPYCYPPEPGGTDLTRIYTLYFAEDIPVEQVCKAMSEISDVEYVHPWYIHSWFLEHNDPQREDQYFLDLIEANAAHDIATGDVRVGVAIIDMGMDMDHEDLVDNLWYNSGEDLNGDREIQNQEQNGQDDDRNGKADDFYGWDFVGDDNNPEDPGGGQVGGHGTHCAGIASAVTNNRVGISSIGFSCGIIPVRVGNEQGVQYGIQGIEYAVDVGAKVISCSWGGPMNERALQDVVDYAWENDVLVIGAAGNMNMDIPVYPGAYDNAISVAATDEDDQRWEQSSYGRWVNVSSPGADILSTYLDNDYFAASGTSMATPLVAGLAVLIRATDPELTAEETFDLILEGAEPIDDQNPNYRGMLGVGRINALNSLERVGGGSPTIDALTVLSDDNHNGRMDAGERVEVMVTISMPDNAPDNMSFTACISSNDETLSFENAEVDLPPCEPGESVTNEDSPFIVNVSDEAIGHTALIMVEADAGFIVINRIFEVLIGVPAVLVVDDGNIQDNAEWYLEAVEGLDVGWQRWETADLGTPDQETFSDRDLVIWAAGHSAIPLDDDDVIEIDEAIGSGVSFLLTGSRIGDDRENHGFLEALFGARHIADSVRADIVEGLAGSPIEEGTRILLSDDEHTGDISPSTMEPFEGGHSLVKYTRFNQDVGIAGVYYIDEENQARCVYLGFALEQVSDALTPRSEILGLIYNWITGEDDVDPVIPVEIPVRLSLEPAFPNPFNGTVKISYTTPEPSNHIIRIIDPSGRIICGLADGWTIGGKHSVSWNANDCPPGVYLVQLSVPGETTMQQKLVLVK